MRPKRAYKYLKKVLEQCKRILGSFGLHLGLGRSREVDCICKALDLPDRTLTWVEKDGRFVRGEFRHRDVHLPQGVHDLIHLAMVDGAKTGQL